VSGKDTRQQCDAVSFNDDASIVGWRYLGKKDGSSISGLAWASIIIPDSMALLRWIDAHGDKRADADIGQAAPLFE